MAPERSRRAVVGAILLAALGLAIWGWNLFLFTTDDAYIAFRYVDNNRMGHGLVWNPPPFRPVEGYTSLLWVLLLGGIWQLTGSPPPASANVLSLTFGYATLVLVGAMVWRMAWPQRFARTRPVWLGLVLLGALTNRTTLAWLSSGLETSLFNFCITLWLYCLLRRRPERGAPWIFATCLAATLTALTRPDGVLAVLATAALIAIDRFDPAVRRLSLGRTLAAASPLLGSPLHFAWRRMYYGEWLPNTYHAKIGTPWPEAGLRYLLSFLIEYSWWIGLGLVLYVLFRASPRSRPDAVRLLRRHYPLLLGLGVLGAQLGYYTLKVGGDHFEYRVLSHLVPLLLAVFAWALARSGLTPVRALVAFGLLLLASYPLPWAHFLETRHLDTRKETWIMVRPIAQRFPAFARPYVGGFDRLQEWLITHHVGMRHQEHKVFAEHQLKRFPSRDEGEQIGRDELIVIWEGVIGVPGWVLPHVAIIDFGGLTDHVVARAPPLHTLEGDRAHWITELRGKRLMAHDRRPPEGYIECFMDGLPEPNVPVRVEPARVRECEERFWDPAPKATEPERVDLLLQGGTVIDGSGQPGRLADVAVVGGRIRGVGALGRLDAARTIDATGLVVAPGFVDLHGHADLILLGGPEIQRELLAAKTAQGVTTLVVGNCGLGVAPATEPAARLLRDINGWMTPAAVEVPAMTVGQYLDRLEREGVALNVGTLVPHGPLRISVMGLAPGAPTEEQLESMRRGVADGLDAGALGLSTGLIYPPGMYSATDELAELARVVAERDALFTAHVRGSSETLLQATEELIEIARRSGARTHHSHLEAVGRRFWPDAARVLALEDTARADGLRISHDVFPYTRAATMMAAIFPPWALEGGLPGLLRRLEQPEVRARVRREIAERVPEWPPWREGGWPHNLVGAVGWDGILVGSLPGADAAGLAGRSLAEIGAERGQDPFDVVVELMLESGGRVGQLVEEISGRDGEIESLLSILTHPHAAVISDAEDYGRGLPHPAHAGAFARVLRLSRERDLLPLAEAVRRMTAYPASLVGLADRGRIAPGAAADLVVFDPELVEDRADWSRPRERARGVDWVVINGRVVVEQGRYRGGLHGAVLRRSR